MEAQGFNECLQGVDVNELFEEFTETSVVKQEIFNNCSVTIVYKKGLTRDLLAVHSFK
jgi:hypothetical protein